MSVNIILANGQLGQAIQTQDGVVGMVLTGAIDGTGDYALGTPILITSKRGLTEAGITTDGNDFVVRQVSEFYNEAGAGAQLYLMLVPNTLRLPDMADIDNENGAKKLLDYAQGKIKVLGIMADEEAIGDVVIEDGINVDTYDGLLNAQALCEQFAAQQTPLRAVVGVGSYTGVVGDLADLTGFTYNRVAALLGDTKGTTHACMGLLLGRVAKIPVQRKVSRVEDRALQTLAAAVGGVYIEEVPYDLPLIAQKGYITFRTFPHLSGIFFSGDRMATLDTDDYKMLARGRVIDKAHVVAYRTFVLTVDDEVPVDPATGKMDALYCKQLEENILNQINLTMTQRGEISGVTAYVDPDQNVLANSVVAVNLGIVPVGYSSTINVTLGFSNPASA